jgi:uncharacterized protein YecE (DUF72 family)
MAVYLGTSGWQYSHWKGRFYPPDVKQTSWLEYFAERLQTVEVNNTFYRLPEKKVFTEWARRTPDDFVLAVKMSRFLTHLRRLREPAEPVERFMTRAAGLGSKLGPVLVQLPPDFQIDLKRLDETLARFPKGTRIAVEMRHPSWFVPETEELLRNRNAALCLADSPRRKTPVWRTSDWTFLRFHEGRATPHPCYGRKALDTWAIRLAESWGDASEIFVYFNNDGRACALEDARVFAAACTRHGLEPTRVPAPSEVSTD